MDLKDFLKSLPSDDARDSFARDCETSLGHMRNCIYDTTKALAPATCVLVEFKSGGKVTRRELREDWRRIWPELAEAEKAGSAA